MKIAIVMDAGYDYVSVCMGSRSVESCLFQCKQSLHEVIATLMQHEFMTAEYKKREAKFSDSTLDK